MASARTLRRVGIKHIYHAVNAGTIRRRLSSQQSPRCIPVVLISDASGCMSGKLEEISRGITNRIVKALIPLLEKRYCDRPEPWMLELCDGYRAKAGKGNARRICLILFLRLIAFLDQRLRCDLQKEWNIGMLKSRIIEKRFAAWRREGPPNSLFCRGYAVQNRVTVA